MTVKSIAPYLFFNGDADAAIEHYQQALKATVEGPLRWGEQGPGCPDGLKGKVMHAALTVGEATLMLSDSPKQAPSAAQRAVSIAIAVDDSDEMAAMFDALASKGTVVEKINDAFWGDRFGVVRDVFGVTWMFTCPTKKD